jgi:hypothetical protein
MQRLLIYPVLCLSLAVTAGACGRRDESPRATAQPSADAQKASDRDQIEVTGCLTGNRDTNQFVLTANATTLSSLTNRAGAGEAETFHYQLVGGNDLQAFVGKEVVVKGAVEGKGKDVNIEAKDKSTPAPATTADAPTPAVKSSEQIEMQVERLNVASITPTGAACQIGQR